MYYLMFRNGRALGRLKGHCDVDFFKAEMIRKLTA